MKAAWLKHPGFWLKHIGFWLRAASVAFFGAC